MVKSYLKMIRGAVLISLAAINLRLPGMVTIALVVFGFLTFLGGCFKCAKKTCVKSEEN